MLNVNIRTSQILSEDVRQSRDCIAEDSFFNSSQIIRHMVSLFNQCEMYLKHSNKHQISVTQVHMFHTVLIVIYKQKFINIRHFVNLSLSRNIEIFRNKSNTGIKLKLFKIMKISSADM